MKTKARTAQEQLALFEAAKADLPIRPPFARGSDTSKAAAESVQVCAGTLRAAVLGQIDDRGPWGLTCDELECLTSLTHQTASARVNELMKLGAIVDSGRRRKTRSGRKATVWVAARVADEQKGHEGGRQGADQEGEHRREGAEADPPAGTSRDPG